MALLVVDPETGASSVAASGAGVVEPDWDPSTNRLAYIREESAEGGCSGICYVVPGVPGDPGGTGRVAAQLVPASRSGRQTSPAWARDGALYHVLTSPCSASPCPAEVHRVTFEVGEDDSGFADVLSSPSEAVVSTGLTGVRDIDVDPQDELRLMIVDEQGVALTREGEVEVRLTGSENVVTATFAPDGNVIVAHSGGGRLTIWDRSGAIVSADTIGEMLAAYADGGGDLGTLDPSDVTALSLSPDVSGAFVLVLAGDDDGKRDPEIAVLGAGDEGGLVVADVRAFPLDVLREGEIQAIAR